MRVFVGEYLCGGGMSEQLSPATKAEGEAMLRAIVADLAEVADVTEVIVPVDTRFGDEVLDAVTVPVDPSQPLLGQWARAAQDCDTALVIAPESGGVLAKAVAVLRAGGVNVLASASDFLRIASDKWLTAKRMMAAGIPHPLYLSKSDRRYEKQFPREGRFVVKPRDGCGTDRVRVFDSFEQAKRELGDHDLLQPWVPGEPLSVALVSSGRQPIFLPAVRQHLSADDFGYQGGSGPVDEERQRRAISLASRVIAEMPPNARGFVGIDLVLGKRPSQDCVIEINPRLTTSYVGLRRMVQGNLAARLFDLERSGFG